MAIPEKKVANNISEYLSILREGYFDLFRGQAENWPLIPSLAREYIMALNCCEMEYFIIQNLQRFGHTEFKNQVNKYSDWILHAQHYGLPSRLLDFTTNPLKALYFAVESESKIDGVIYAICGYGDTDFPPLNLENISFYRPNHINSRITAQESVFAVFPLHSDGLALTGPEIKPLQEYEDETARKITIPYACKPEIKKELSVLGVNKMSIYPGVEGIVEKVKEECGLI